MFPSPSLSLLSLPRCLVGSEGFGSSLAGSAASSIWGQPKATIFQLEPPASRWQQHWAPAQRTQLTGGFSLSKRDLSSKAWGVLSVWKYKWKPTLSHIPVWLLFLWREKNWPDSWREENLISNEKSWISDWKIIIWLIIKPSGSRQMEFCHVSGAFFATHPKLPWKAVIVLEGTGTKAAAVKLSTGTAEEFPRAK